MTRFFRSTYATLVWLFSLALFVQFFLAGLGAFKVLKGNAWGPHLGLGDLLLLASLLLLLLALAARVPRSLIGHTGGLFALMIVQFILAALRNAKSLKAIAAFHPLNALVIVGATMVLANRSRIYLPIRRLREGSIPGHPNSTAGSTGGAGAET